MSTVIHLAKLHPGHVFLCQHIAGPHIRLVNNFPLPSLCMVADINSWLQDALGMYCHHILADYITLAAAPASAARDGQSAPGLPVKAAAALRRAACALYGACSPAQVYLKLPLRLTSSSLPNKQSRFSFIQQKIRASFLAYPREAAYL